MARADGKKPEKKKTAPAQVSRGSKSSMYYASGREQKNKERRQKRHAKRLEYFKRRREKKALSRAATQVLDRKEVDADTKA